jgi:hypothetical protein
MSEAEEIWRRKADDEIRTAAAVLGDYTDEGRRIIQMEADRRGLNIAPIVQAAATLQEHAPAHSGRCAYCDTRILFGGIRDGVLRFCNARCRSQGVLLAVSRRVPDAIVNGELRKVHQGACPRCGGRGPVDVHTSHRVWSAVVVTSWSSRVHIVCRRCGSDTRMSDAFFSLACGWWAVPWGPLMTIVQVVRNIVGNETDPSKPSPQLEKLVRLRLAEDLLER